MDPLGLLRAAVPKEKEEPKVEPFPTTSSDPSDAEPAELHEATHLYLRRPTPICLSLDLKTRFVLEGEEVDLRSVYLAYLHRELGVPDYLAKFADLNAQLPADKQARQLSFVERIELVDWLQGSEGSESDLIKPLEIAPDAVAASGTVPVVAGTGASLVQTSVNGRPVKVIDARLQAIYNGERKMGDRNTVLRGIKPTDFSHVRKYRELFMKKSKDPKSGQLPTRSIPQAMPQKGSVSGKRVDPIIILSPSASSLLRMSNVKTFLDTGLFVPFAHQELANQNAANLLHIVRPLRQISEKPFRFVLVDSPDQFKTEYWERVVAIFTTGQTWQFRGYKWREPQELFSHVLGIYVGEKGLPVPTDVKSWGRNVATFQVDKWDEKLHGQVDHDSRLSRRWRDREVVEDLWRTIENSMKGNSLWKR